MAAGCRCSDVARLITDVKVVLTAPEGINLVVVKVETNQPGLVGYGCATFAYRHLAVKCLIEEYLKPLLVGRDAEAIEELWQLMHQNAYWRNGPIENNAISGINMALWDLKGKQAGMPLYQLFGGKVREGVPIYRHADGRDMAELSDNIPQYREQGITHIRCQSGGYGGGGFGDAPAHAPRTRRKASTSTRASTCATRSRCSIKCAAASVWTSSWCTTCMSG